MVHKKGERNKKRPLSAVILSPCALGASNVFYPPSSISAWPTYLARCLVSSLALNPAMMVLFWFKPASLAVSSISTVARLHTSTLSRVSIAGNHTLLRRRQGDVEFTTSTKMRRESSGSGNHLESMSKYVRICCSSLSGSLVRI